MGMNMRPGMGMSMRLGRGYEVANGQGNALNSLWGVTTTPVVAAECVGWLPLTVCCRLSVGFRTQVLPSNHPLRIPPTQLAD